MDELVENILLLSHQLEDISERLFQEKDYKDALHDGRIDYSKDRETHVDEQIKELSNNQKEILNNMKNLLEKGGE